MNLYGAFECAFHMFARMVQDNPYLEVRRSLSLDQTELDIFGKCSRLNQIWENDPHPID